LRDLAQGHAASHDPDQQIRNHQGDEHDEQHQPQAIRVPALAEVLHLGDDAVALAEGPQPRPDEVEHRRNDQRRRRCHQGEDADPGAVTLARSAQQRKGGHVRAEQRHE
jgi:hypothetical protein